MKRLTERDDKGNLLFNGEQVYAGDFYEAVSCLEEYEDTGLTPEQIRELKERDTAMEINEIHVDEYYCPACGAANNCDQGIVEDNFCPRCGQRIKWEE